MSVEVETPDLARDVQEIEPTQEELASLERITDCIPWTSWLIVIFEGCESFAYYGVSETFQNYIQFPISGPNDTQAGALGLGQQTATSLTIFFQCFCALSPIAGAIMADQFWGKYRTMATACLIYVVGLSILLLTSIPPSIRAGTALPGLILAMVILGVASGGLGSNMIPFMAEQYTRRKPIIREIRGVKKIVDPQITIQSLISRFYWAINLGSLSSLITTNIERYHSFWLAYLVPLIVINGSIIVLFIGRHRFRRTPPTGSLLVRAGRVAKTAVRIRWKLGKQKEKQHILDYAKEGDSSSKRVETTGGTNQFIEDLKQAIRACRVFAFYPFYHICFNQLVGNLTSQAAQMNVGPFPNDILQTVDPIVLIIFIPIFDKVIYPALRRVNIRFGPIIRITCGFFCASLAMAWTALVQHLIYSTGPNYAFSQEPCSTCQKFNNISAAWQIPSYFLIAISEIFAAITGLEYAYTHAPASMKSIVMSMYLLTSAIGSALNVALIPVTVNPKLLWMYASLAIAAAMTGSTFFLVFRKENQTEQHEIEMSMQREQPSATVPY